MSELTRAGDLVADIVADVVSTARRGTAVYGRNRFHAPWGVAFPAGSLTSVHVITGGACWLVPEDGPPVQLTRGDVALVPAGRPHALVDVPGRSPRPIEHFLGGLPGETDARDLVIPGDGPATRLVCGGFVLGAGPQHPITAMLPPVLHLNAADARERGLAAVVDLLAAEVDRSDPGASAVVASLVDLLFVYLMRAWLAEQSTADAGWARALYDPVVGAALALIHRAPADPWTVTSLARAVNLPRATFSRRFRTLTGQAPMSYVIDWRMAMAARLLRDEHALVRDVADRVGYDSEFAFARAFKRAAGQAPGRYRRANSMIDSAVLE